MGQDIRLTLPSLHPGQNQVVPGRRRFNTVACGRRWGKSYFGVRAAAHPLLDGCPVGWFAPNYKFLAEAWRNVRRVLSPVTASINKSERRIELITGGSIDFWSLVDEDAGRSYKYKRVIIDEAGLVKNLETVWHEAIRPTLTDLKGDAWLLGTPKGRNFFWQAFTRGQDALETEWSSFTAPTSSNPTIPDIEAEVEAARLGMPDRAFRQEYLAEFIDEGGGVFRMVREAIDAGRTQNETAKPGRRYRMGVDLARIADFTILTALDDTGRQVHHERFNQISWERQISRIVQVADQFSAQVNLDCTGVGDPIFEAVQSGLLAIRSKALVHPFQFTNASKEALIDHLAMGLEQGAYRLMDIEAQTNELLAYQYELTPSRNVRMNAPEGMHDDCVIALALACHTPPPPQSKMVALNPLALSGSFNRFGGR
jgi:hypothetical protein